jgi:hypothetical protein
MTLPPLTDLALFMAAVLLIALYGLSASGHFPAEHRATALKSGAGAAVFWGTLALASAAAPAVLASGLARLPWYAAVIGAGLMLLVAPLVLQRFPDRFVDGARSLLVFGGGAAVLAVLLAV